MEKSAFSEKEIRQRLALFQEMVQSCSSVRFWEYELHGRTLADHATPPADDLQEYFFRFSRAYASLQYYLNTEEERTICILSNEVSLQWLCDFFGDRVIVMGPIYMNESSQRKMRRIVDSQQHTVEIRRRVFAALEEIPTIPSNVLFADALMLHECLTGTKAAMSQIRRPRVPDRRPHPGVQDEEGELLHAGVQQVENMLLDAIRTGSMDFQAALDSAAMISPGVRSRRNDNLRAAKDSMITLIALASRAAIAGGLPAETAYSMCDRYVDMAEDCADMGQCADLGQTIVQDFAERVHAYRAKTPYSRPVHQCIDMIDMNLTKKITLEDLASACGYTAYYLSRRFRQETGETIAQYTQRKRIETSARMLVNTDLPVQEICSMYQFNSPSYYTTLFQRYLKESPTSYRARERGE